MRTHSWLFICCSCFIFINYIITGVVLGYLFSCMFHHVLMKMVSLCKHHFLRVTTFFFVRWLVRTVIEFFVLFLLTIFCLPSFIWLCCVLLHYSKVLIFYQAMYSYLLFCRKLTNINIISSYCKYETYKSIKMHSTISIYWFYY